MAVAQRGDILMVSLDPVVGHETRGSRPVLVLTKGEFNSFGDVLVAPITQGGDYSRYAGFAVNLTQTKTQGVVLVNKARTLDLRARQAKKVERAPAAVVDEALARFATLLE